KRGGEREMGEMKKKLEECEATMEALQAAQGLAKERVQEWQREIEERQAWIVERREEIAGSTVDEAVWRSQWEGLRRQQCREWEE
ncbi:hypothetical protein LTR56_027094, partial [Elasticomyces elasticus]